AIPGPHLNVSARQWRGCGNCGFASSAPGGGIRAEHLAALAIPGPHLNVSARQWRGCGNCGFASSAPGGAKPRANALRCPENRSGLRFSSGFPTAAEIAALLLPPPAAQSRNS
ncbi:MAG: hypothetical protein IKO83_09960, partial [Oscillospiraceae bacterium]|nr:hypothetical protein [Oscillospiraceae bacterium]